MTKSSCTFEEACLHLAAVVRYVDVGDTCAPVRTRLYRSSILVLQRPSPLVRIPKVAKGIPSPRKNKLTVSA